jgi:hypothetical protein
MLIIKKGIKMTLSYLKMLFPFSLFLIATCSPAPGHFVDLHVPYDYSSRHEHNIGLSIKVIDKRQDVILKRNEPGWIGNYRGGFWNPFPVYTKNKKDVCEYLRNILYEGCNSMGIKIDSTKPPTLELQFILKQFYVDAHGKVDVNWDIGLALLKNSNIIYSKSDSGTVQRTVSGRDYYKAVDNNVPSYLKTILERCVFKNDSLLSKLNY